MSCLCNQEWIRQIINRIEINLQRNSKNFDIHGASWRANEVNGEIDREDQSIGKVVAKAAKVTTHKNKTAQLDKNGKRRTYTLRRKLGVRSSRKLVRQKKPNVINTECNKYG